MKLLLLAPALFLTASSTPVVEPVTANALEATPHGALMASVAAIRENNLLRYMELTLSPEMVEEAHSAWDEYRAVDPGPGQVRKFSEVMAVLNGPHAGALIMGILEPKLEEARPQLQQMSGMAAMMGQMAIAQNESLSDDEKEEGAAVLGALTDWLSQSDLGDSVRARRAIELLCGTVRGFGFESMSDLLDMEFDVAMARAGDIFGAVKGILAIYGLNVDAWLDSIEAETVGSKGEAATVRVTFDVLGITSDVETAMVWTDGHWVVQASQELTQDSQQEAGF